MVRSLRLSPRLSFLLFLFVPHCPAQVNTPPQSTFFSTAAEEAYSTLQLSGTAGNVFPGGGDLWPSCWADDGNLYAANGDGKGFGQIFLPMQVSMIAGIPPSLTGTFVAGDVGYNWSGSSYNDKPTGMLCSGGAIYLAFQNLNTNFNDAPAASVLESTNHGVTWTSNPTSPMFGTPGNPTSPAAYLFTTIFFLDYGQNSANAIDNYVYAYGIDKNWQYQQTLYLARVPKASVLDRSTWEFYTADGSANPWSADITKKQPVLTDDRLVYPKTFASDCGPNESIIGQGGVTYDAPLHRYLFASWSCPTHEFYEAPQPWGPWSHIVSNDFGSVRLLQNQGMYGTSIPSKFISSDGTSMYLQSNIANGAAYYTYSLRKLFLQPYVPSSPTNMPSGSNLALAPGTQATSKSTHFGTLCGPNCSDQLNSGNLTASEDDFDEESKPTDWWGYTWPRSYNFNQVTFESGNVFSDGGWFSSSLRVQARQNFQWVDIPGVAIAPAYPYNNTAGAHTTYTFNLPDTVGDGVRVIGTPGGTHYFTSVSQLGVYFKDGSTNLMADPGFELQQTSSVSSPWIVDGPDPHGIDRGLGYAHSGANNAWIRDSTTNWNATSQIVSVTPNTNYYATAWVQNNFTTNIGYFSVRASDGKTVIKEITFTSSPNYTQLNVIFNSGSNSTVKVTTGFFGQGVDLWARIDDLSLM